MERSKDKDHTNKKKTKVTTFTIPFSQEELNNIVIYQDDSSKLSKNEIFPTFVFGFLKNFKAS